MIKTMKKKLLKFTVSVILGVALSANIVYASDANTVIINLSSSSNSIEEITPFDNATGYQYKEVDGILYKRLWSYTYKRWEEPYWSIA